MIEINHVLIKQTKANLNQCNQLLKEYKDIIMKIKPFYSQDKIH
jgi:hypothetical protein